MLECWNSGGCAQLGNLYILTIVVVVMDDSNLRCYKGLFRISGYEPGFLRAQDRLQFQIYFIFLLL